MHTSLSVWLLNSSKCCPTWYNKLFQVSNNDGILSYQRWHKSIKSIVGNRSGKDEDDDDIVEENDLLYVEFLIYQSNSFLMELNYNEKICWIIPPTEPIPKKQAIFQCLTKSNTHRRKRTDANATEKRYGTFLFVMFR